MKVLVTGYNGQLGFDICKEFESINKNIKDSNLDEDNLIEFIGTTRNDFDITCEKDTKDFIRKYNPNVVIHCAAYTQVDNAEDNIELCESVNILGTKYIAEVVKDINSKLIFISTDYVFNGKKLDAYEVHDEKNPINIYGRSKSIAEDIVLQEVEKSFIIRISWVFGINGNNFIKTMINLGKTRDSLNVVSDQEGSPTSTKDLSKLIYEIMNSDKYGIYHGTNEGYCSWADFARYIFEVKNMNVTVSNILSSEYKTKAKRPSNSKLSKVSLDNAGFTRLRTWQDSVKDFIISNNL